ncbi:hypothetical protein [Amycolatopsis sp. NPDC051102]|uniref:hypothetical protein n=1 Tax=Amycolatopsis sp. NPDC051102 TaxID=3155163 RepID=UPI00343F8399
MTNARPSRRQIEMDAVDLDFDFFADTTGLAGDSVLTGGFDGFADLVDPYAGLAEIDEALANLDAPVAPVISLPLTVRYELGEVA